VLNRESQPYETRSCAKITCWAALAGRHLLAGAALLTALAFAHPASALTMKECSKKYKAEQEAGTLVTKSWNDFRKAECGRGATLEATKPGKTAKEAAKDTSKEKAAGLKMVKSSEQADRNQGYGA
jgi:hypothetical protein